MIERSLSDRRQFNPMHDAHAVIALGAFRGTPVYEEKARVVRKRILLNLETDLRERLDAAESTVIYEIRDGKLFEPGSDEPFEEVMKRGAHTPREKAEIIGFSTTVQGCLADPETPDGASVLDVSPPGGGYVKNYLDVHVKSKGRVITTRYRSNLTNDQYRKKIVALSPAHEELLPKESTDIDFKLHPVIIPSHFDFSNPDDLATFMLSRKIGVSKEVMDEVSMEAAPFWANYLHWLEKNPWAFEDHENSYVEAQSEGVEIWRRIEYRRLGNHGGSLRMLDSSEKKELPTGGCGGGGCSTEGPSESDQYGKLSFDCPDCKKTNTRQPNELIKNCQKCGSSKVLPLGLLQFVRVS